MFGLSSKLLGTPLWKMFAGLAGLLFLGFMTQTIRIEGFWFIVGFKEDVAVLRINLEEARAATATEIAKHKATKLAYEDAQIEAARQEAERIARVVSEQKEITDEVRSEYARRLAAARAAYERLRAQQAGNGAGGTPESQPVRCVSNATGGADEAPGDCGLSDDQRLIATEQAIQLDGLITWIGKQMGVDPNR